MCVVREGGGVTVGTIPTDFNISIISSDPMSEKSSISSEGGIAGTGRGVGIGGREAKIECALGLRRG